MKLLDYILLSAATAFFIIGMDQIIRASVPVQDIYWIFMLSLGALMIINYRKFKKKDSQEADSAQESQKNKRK